MKLTRRDLLKLIGLTAAGTALGEEPALAADHADPMVAPPIKTAGATKTYSICPYCGVGCGIDVYTKDGKVIAAEGNPDHPINRGSLCPKGQGLASIAANRNPNRLTKVKYRPAGGTEWQEISMNEALDKVAALIKKTRDENFIEVDGKGVTVNHTEALASLGGAALDNEECYLVAKLIRALGVNYFEHQARICHSSTVGALGPSFGRGAMTNHWTDLGNSDCFFVIGSNPSRNHPMAFKWITYAQETRGAKLIVADPRFTTSAGLADLYARFRPGTDIALIGGMINYIFKNNLQFTEYVKLMTDGPFLVKEGFNFDENQGLFTGYDESIRKYKTADWDYQRGEDGKPLSDPTMQNPNCVLNILKRHYSRYTPEMVSDITGVPPERIVELAKTYAEEGGGRTKNGTILYAMGTTQHTVGVDYIRSYVILQLLLGNIGVAGGGINAMRGESNVQGSTDMAMLFHIIPGYMACPSASAHPDLKTYNEKETPKYGYWANKPKFLISLLKAFWGEYATAERDFCYDFLPKLSGGTEGNGYSWIALFQAMHKGTIKGLTVFGQNPMVGGPDSNFTGEALEQLDWMACFDLWETETSIFWKRPGANAADIKTEVFLFPAAASFEKEGSITNSGRWIQWRYKAIDPPGEAKSDLRYLDELVQRLKAAYESEGGPVKEAITKLNWNYSAEGEAEPDVHRVAMEINGYYTELSPRKGEQMENFTKLAADGTTASGNWIMSGFYPKPDTNLAERHDNGDPTGLLVFPNWTFAWPVNRHVLYNRCSADDRGQPWDPARALVKFNPASADLDPKSKEDWGSDWTFNDVPDFSKTAHPKTSIASPFIMPNDLHGNMFVPGGKVKGGPFPEHYEPFETPLAVNPLHPGANRPIDNPTIVLWADAVDSRAEPGNTEFPLVGTTHRQIEHWLSGAMTRNLEPMVELAPEMHVEMSPELAEARGIKPGEWVNVVSPRGSVPARAMITKRLKALTIGGVTTEIISLPWHWGYAGLRWGGDEYRNYSANQLTANVGDSNTMIPEYKVFLCNIQKI
ncbi:MAG: formate dehydrogenase-N subunit alpha [bacterium]